MPDPKLPPSRTKEFGGNPLLVAIGNQINPLVALDIDGQRLILVVGLAGPLCQMDMDDALGAGALDVEFESQMLGAPLVRVL